MHDVCASSGRRTSDPLGDPAAAYPPPGTHMPALDGLRGLAILMVLAFHFSLGHLAPARFALAIPYTVAGMGWVGVDLFFVLSGFLITGILYDAKTSGTYFRDFYAKRVLRIFPLYYGVLVAFFIAVPLVHPLRSVTELKPVEPWAWLYATNIKDSLAGDWCFDKTWVRLNQFWSLAVEEHFYMIWPVAVLLLSRRGIIRLCLTCMAIALALRVWLLTTTYNTMAVYVLTPCRMDGLALGGLLAVAARGPGGIDALVKPSRYGAAAAFLAYSLVALFGGGPDAVGSPLVQSIGFTLLVCFFGALLILAVTGGRVARFFRHRTLRFFGKYSYGLYIFHQVFRPAYDRLFPPEHLSRYTRAYIVAVGLYMLLATGCTLAISMASWHLFEKHFLKLKHHFDRRPAHRPAPRDLAAAPQPTIAAAATAS